MLQLSGSHHNLDTDLLIYVIVAYFNGQMFDQGNWKTNNDASAYDRIHYILKASKVVWTFLEELLLYRFKYLYSIYYNGFKLYVPWLENNKATNYSNI